MFTLPDCVALLALQNGRFIYNLLFRAVSESVGRIAADPRHLGARIGFFAVLHTWGQTLTLILILTAWSRVADSRSRSSGRAPGQEAWRPGEFKDHSVWDEDLIEERSKTLFNVAVTIWPRR